MKCPKCASYNTAGATECEKCGVIFAHAKRTQQAAPVAPTCAWSHQGRSCMSRGIMSEGTTGNAQWYCREHWERLQRRDPTETGNAIPTLPKSQAVTAWHAAWKARYGDKKVMPEKPMPNPLEAA
jgi:hypothetical protein